MKLILASQSEIRKRALNLLNFPYEVIPANIDEKAIRDPDPFKQALKLSEAKALEIGKSHHGIIIANDYISRYPVTKFAGGHETDAVARFAEKVVGNYNFSPQSL